MFFYSYESDHVLCFCRKISSSDEFCKDECKRLALDSLIGIGSGSSFKGNFDQTVPYRINFTCVM